MAVGSRATLQVRDYSPSLAYAEYGSVRLPSYQIDAANLATWLTGWGAYKTALAGIIEGVLAKESVTIYDTILDSTTLPAESAQRERKIMMTYVGDNTGFKFFQEIPTADLAALTLLPNDQIELADGGVMAAYVSGFEALARNPKDDAETVTVIGAKHVGRNT
jgi:hypothetical protein